jgi:hypothetical protein
MSDMVSADDLVDWFDVDDEGPVVAEAPATFLSKLKEKVPTLQELGIRDSDTYAGYEDGRLWIGIDIIDFVGKSSIAFLRVEVTDSEWIAAWVSPSLGTDPVFAHTGPQEEAGGPISDPVSGADAALSWLEAQLRRPISRYVWRDQDTVVAKTWHLEDSGRGLIVSGPKELWSRPETATETAHVRP